MRARLGALLGVALTALFVWGLGWIAVGFAMAGGIVGWGLALAVAILIVLTVWVTWREVLFGVQAARLARLYSADPDGAAAAEAADSDAPRDERAEFEAARTALESGEETGWRPWFRLALAYDAVRDRKQARMALRRAITEARRDGAERP